jgi:hypothetical protein
MAKAELIIAARPNRFPGRSHAGADGHLAKDGKPPQAPRDHLQS